MDRWSFRRSCGPGFPSGSVRVRSNCPRRSRRARRTHGPGHHGLGPVSASCAGSHCQRENQSDSEPSGCPLLAPCGDVLNGRYSLSSRSSLRARTASWSPSRHLRGTAPPRRLRRHARAGGFPGCYDSSGRVGAQVVFEVGAIPPVHLFGLLGDLAAVRGQIQ